MPRTYQELADTLRSDLRGGVTAWRQYNAVSLKISVCPLELRNGPRSALRRGLLPCGCGGGLWLVAGRRRSEFRDPHNGPVIARPWCSLPAWPPRPRQDPVRAVGKLQVPSVSFYQSCTATLVAPSRVLTASHCVYNTRTQRYHLPGSLHFLIGYDGSRYAGHALAIRFETGEGYDPTRPKETIGSDWALITLDTRLGSPDRILPMIHEVPEIGSTIMLGGYQQDHPLVLMADIDCRIVGRVTDFAGRLLVRHNCTGTGVSAARLC
jgi:Trypsin